MSQALCKGVQIVGLGMLDEQRKIGWCESLGILGVPDTRTPILGHSTCNGIISSESTGWVSADKRHFLKPSDPGHRCVLLGLLH